MNDALEQVILVDANDRQTGTDSKLDVHRRGDLHRAFSVVVHDSAGRLLLQKRHVAKYHSGGLWTNACCGHPRPGEDVLAAASRRLDEEMGFTCALKPLGTFMYRAEFENGLIEHELVHLFSGTFDGNVAPDPQEAEGYRWRFIEDVQNDVAMRPSRYSVWFRKYVAAKWPLAHAQAD